MHDATRQLEQATWAVAEGRATAEERALLEADPVAWRRTLDRLLVDAEASLASVRGLSGPERERVVADFEDDLARLPRSRSCSRPLMAPPRPRSWPRSWAGSSCRPRGPTGRSWSGPAAAAPPRPRTTTWPTCSRPSAALPSAGACTRTSCCRPARRAEALAIPIRESLGWLVAVSGSERGRGRQPERDVDEPSRPPRRSGWSPPARSCQHCAPTARPTDGASTCRSPGTLHWSTSTSSRRCPPACPAPSSPSPRPPRGRPRVPCSARSSTPS